MKSHGNLLVGFHVVGFLDVKRPPFIPYRSPVGAGGYNVYPINLS